MKIRTLLIDSSYLFKRSLFGAKDTYTPSFGHIGGLYQFFTSARKLIKEHSINKVVSIWDGENGGIDRFYIDPTYKSNREDKSWNAPIQLSEKEIKREQEKKRSVLKQRKRIQQYSEELYFRQIEVDNIEADDIIAKYCIDNHNKENIFVYTNDRDFAQLLDLNITILFDNIDTPITKDNFLFKFGYHYKNAMTIKIIEGDTSDMIKGVGGLKKDTLLKHFPEIKFKPMMVKELCAKADKINQDRINGKPKKKPLKALENLVNNIDRLVMNYKMINLRKPFLNEEVKEELDNLNYPLDEENRGSKQLLKMMNEDEFLMAFGGTFPSYVEPFFPIIMNEKRILKEYEKKEDKLI